MHIPDIQILSLETRNWRKKNGSVDLVRTLVKLTKFQSMDKTPARSKHQSIRPIPSSDGGISNISAHEMPSFKMYC